MITYTEFEHMQALRWAKKILLQERLGEKCIKCGCADYRVIEFHHPDNNKEKSVSRMLSHTIESIWVEARKCQLLCSNCHAEEHSNSRKTPKRATRKTYKENMLNYLCCSCCSSCGYKRANCALDFHHVFPDSKKLKLANVSYSKQSKEETKKIVEKELDKCIVLCRNCHILKHLEDGGLTLLFDLINLKKKDHVPTPPIFSKNREIEINEKYSEYRLRLANILRVWRKCNKNIALCAKFMNVHPNTISDNLSWSKSYAKYRLARSIKTSKYVGVSLDKRTGKWRVYTKINGKSKYVGGFILELDAKEAYDNFKAKIYNEGTKN